MRLLCVVSKPPFEGSKVIEQIEAAMVAAVFDIEVTLLFTGLGIHCLTEDQQGDVLASRSPGKLISGLDMYDINNIYADKASLADFRLVEGVTVVDKDAQQELLRLSDLVIGGSA